MTPRTTDIMLATVKHFQIPLEGLVGIGREPQIVIARHVAWFLERKRGLSTPQIGDLYNRDASTVLVGSKCAEERAAAGDVRYAPHVEAIEEEVKRQASIFAERPVHVCPTCGTDVIELQRQISDIHRRLTEMGVKP